jgi:hypothetical protein
MATRIIPCLVAAVIIAAGSHAALAQYVQPPPVYIPPPVQYTPPLQYQVPSFAQPVRPPPPPMVVVPFNAFGSTIR